MTTGTADLTIRKSIYVEAPRDRAFAVFTERVDDWWPATHSFSKAPDRLETPWEVGATAYEIKGEDRYPWWEVTAYDPPSRIALRWLVGGGPTTDVEVTFAAEGVGTRVELVHVGWAAHGDDAADRFAGYDSGWDVVLEPYRALAAAA